MVADTRLYDVLGAPQLSSLVSPPFADLGSCALTGVTPDASDAEIKKGELQMFPCLYS